MASICPVCSTENRDGANFCRNCGIKLSAAGDRIPPPPTPEREWATTAPAPRPWTSRPRMKVTNSGAAALIAQPIA